MIKEIPPYAWVQLDGLAQVEIVKTAAAGLRGGDYADFVKRSSHPLALWVRDNPPGPGGVYVHSHIFSYLDVAGLNRNADGYSRGMARTDLPSYEKYGRAYLNHRNTDPAASYGVVRRAFNNEPMGRAELVVELNGNKEAAARNGGRVAESTLHKLASHVDVPVSQSCRVPYDVCLGCNHKARNRSEYCTELTCKYGGCRDNLGRAFEDGFHLGVDNPKCQFFDWSDVSATRGADRTAFITGKVASADRVVGGAELAERLGLVAPTYLLDPHVVAGMGALRTLAATHYPEVPAGDYRTMVEVRAKLAAHSGGDVTLEARALGGPAGERGAHAGVATLAGRGIVLPPDIWLSLLTGAPAEKCAAVYAGGVDVGRLVDDPALPDYLGETAAVVPDATTHWFAPSAAAHARETQLALLRIGTDAVKMAARRVPSTPVPEPVAKEAALRYLAYLGSVLAAHENSSNLVLLRAEAIRHSRNAVA